MGLFIAALFFFGLAVILFRRQAKEQKDALLSIPKRKSNPFADFIGRGTRTIIFGDEEVRLEWGTGAIKGQVPDVSFRYESIKSIEIKDAFMGTAGSFIFKVDGEPKRLLQIDPYCVYFLPVQAEEVRFLRDQILKRAGQARQVSVSASDNNNADELKKYADLKDQGIITEEEFQAKKKQILDL